MCNCFLCIQIFAITGEEVFIFKKVNVYTFYIYFFNNIIKSVCQQAFSESLLNVENVFTLLWQTHRLFN